MENLILLFNDRLYISHTFLKQCGISPKTFECWALSKEGQKIHIGKYAYVYYKAIPAPSRAKLPNEDYLRGQILFQEHNTEVSRVYECLKTAYNQFIPRLNYILEHYTIPPEKAQTFARKWAVWEWIMNNYKERQRGNLELLFNAYIKQYPGSFSGIQNFSRFMRLCREKGIEHAVVDQRTFRSIECRVSPMQEEWIKILLDDRKFSYPQIHAKIVKACADAGLKPCSLSWLKKYAKRILNNPELYKKRYGADATREQLPYVPLEKARNPNTEWQIDGWTVPFWVNGAEYYERWVLVAVWDSHSRKIVGFSIGKTENTELIMAALADAIQKTGVLPSELVMDKHSFTQTQVYSRFKEETERYGMAWTITSNPRRKNVAERYFQYLDAICKDHRAYLGQGVKSKGKNARRTPETYEKLRRPDNQYTPTELQTTITDVVLTYNNTPLNPLNGATPKQQYAATPAIHAIQLNKAQQLLLFEQPQTYTVRSGTITIKRGTKRYFYQLPAALYEQYNNHVVYVRHEDLTQGIYLVDPNTGEIIADLRPVQAAPTSIKDQQVAGIKPILKNAGKKKGIKSKAIQKLHEGIKANPDALEFIAPYAIPKDVRQDAMQNRELNRELADRAINVNMLPIRQQQAPIIAPPARSKESPFYTNEPFEMKKLSKDDLFPKED